MLVIKFTHTLLFKLLICNFNSSVCSEAVVFVIQSWAFLSLHHLPPRAVVQLQGPAPPFSPFS